MKKKLLFIVTYKASFRIFSGKIPFKKLSAHYTIYISDDNSDDQIFEV